MSKLAIAAQVKAGEQLLAEINGQRTRVDELTQAVIDVASGYATFRDQLGGDAEDEAFADQRFADAVARAQTKFDNVTPQVRAVIDQFFTGLGYTRSK